MGLLVALIGLVGIVNIITRSFLFEGLRSKVPARWKSIRYLVQCPACMGTWVGFLFYLVAVCDYSTIYCFVNLFIWGGLVSFASAVGVTVLDYLLYLKQESANRLVSGAMEDGDDD